MNWPRSAILDTNVLLLWLAGAIDLSLFVTWKRVQAFEPSDYELLIAQLNVFESVCTTPHVLAETSNFVDQAPSYRREDLIRLFWTFIATSKEHYEAALSLSSLEEFALLGLADAGLVSLSRKHIVVTTDFRLAGRIAKEGGYSLNLNHLRGDRLLRS